MKKTTATILMASALLGAGCASKSGADTEGSVRESLRGRLEAVHADGKTLFGHHDDPVYGHTWCGDSGRSDVLETVGDYPAVMSWDIGRIELGDSANIDGVPFERIRAEVIAQHRRGGINTFSWHLFSPRDSSDCWTVGDSLTVTEILADTESAKVFRSQLDAVARFLNSLTDADGNDIPVIFRPWHEHSGSWFWWGAPYCTPEQYRSLWKLTREALDGAGVDNVLYAYSPDRVPDAQTYMERYPGDEIVDIVGADIYHFNGADGMEDYISSASTALAIVDSVAAAHGKIPAFTETGMESIPMDNWWTEALLPILEKHHPAYVVVWRNASDKPGHFYAPFPGHPSEDSFKKFHNSKSVIFSKEINDYK